jgi:hypothetical protein
MEFEVGIHFVVSGDIKSPYKLSVCIRLLV